MNLSLLNDVAQNNASNFSMHYDHALFKLREAEEKIANKERQICMLTNEVSWAKREIDKQTQELNFNFHKEKLYRIFQTREVIDDLVNFHLEKVLIKDLRNIINDYYGNIPFHGYKGFTDKLVLYVKNNENEDDAKLFYVACKNIINKDENT